LLANKLVNIFNYFGENIEEISWINKPPVSIIGLLDMNTAVKIWEARQMAGLEYDEEDIEQNKYLKNGTIDKSVGSKE